MNTSTVWDTRIKAFHTFSFRWLWPLTLPYLSGIVGGTGGRDETGGEEPEGDPDDTDPLSSRAAAVLCGIYVTLCGGGTKRFHSKPLYYSCRAWQQLDYLLKPPFHFAEQDRWKTAERPWNLLDLSGWHFTMNFQWSPRDLSRFLADLSVQSSKWSPLSLQ